MSARKKPSQSRRRIEIRCRFRFGLEIGNDKSVPAYFLEGKADAILTASAQGPILKANPTVKDANLIAVGQVLIIPTPPPPDVIKSSAGSSASPSPSGP